MEYKVLVINGLNLRNINLHCGSAGTNGGVAARMWTSKVFAENNPKVEGILETKVLPPPGGTSLDSSLESKDVQDIVCNGVQLNTIASLYQAIRNGSIYLSIHSEVYPDGVARGQIFL